MFIQLLLQNSYLLKCIKIKCTLVQALRLCTGCTAHRRSRGIALLFHDHSTRRGWGVSVTPRPFFTPGKDPVPIVQEAGWAPGLVWTGAESVAPTGIRSPDRPAGSQLLYRLRYPAHSYFTYHLDIKKFHMMLTLRYVFCTDLRTHGSFSLHNIEWLIVITRVESTVQ